MKKPVILSFALLALLAAPSPARAGQTHPRQSIASAAPAVPQAYLACVSMASLTYQVPTQAVASIMRVEGGRNGYATGPNFNGTYDLGLMQVNSRWVPRLARLWHVDYTTAYIALRDNGCENVYVGTWILKQKIAETGSLYSGIASYHSATRGLGLVYADKVSLVMQQPAPAFLP